MARHDEPNDFPTVMVQMPGMQNSMIPPQPNPFVRPGPYEVPYDYPQPYDRPRERTAQEDAEQMQRLKDILDKANKKVFDDNANLQKENAAMRTFATGATRNVDVSKHDYEGFVSPLVLEGYGRYMHAHRVQADGSLRASDNWQKGIPIAAYRSSLIRHVFTAWSIWRGWPVPAEQVGTEKVVPTLKDTLYAVLFNVMGYLHELEKENLPKQDATVPQTATEIAKPFIKGNPVDSAALIQRTPRGGILRRYALQDREVDKAL